MAKYGCPPSKDWQNLGFPFKNCQNLGAPLYRMSKSGCPSSYQKPPPPLMFSERSLRNPYSMKIYEWWHYQSVPNQTFLKPILIHLENAKQIKLWQFVIIKYGFLTNLTTTRASPVIQYLCQLGWCRPSWISFGHVVSPLCMLQVAIYTIRELLETKWSHGCGGWHSLM